MGLLKLNNGVTLHYNLHKRDGNQLKQTLVIINGTFNILENWEFLHEHCGDYCDILTFDVRNQGKTTKFQDIYTYQEYVNDLHSLLTMLGIKSAILLGYSSGSSIAVDYALQHPALPSKLILAAPLINPFCGFRTRLFHQSLLNSLEKGGLAGLFCHAYPLVYGDNFCSENQRSFIAFRERFMSMFDPHHLAIQMKVWLQSNTSIDKLKQVLVPIHFIIGSEDPLNTIGSIQEIARELANTDVTIIEKSGHSVHIENPAFFAQTLQKNTQRIAARQPA